MRRHCLIIGGTKGIGRATAKLFEQENHLVSIIGHHPPDNNRKIKNACYWAVDLLDEMELSKALNDITKTNGRVNCLLFFQRYRGDKNIWEGEFHTSLSATKNIIEKNAAIFVPDDCSCSIVIVSSLASRFIFEDQPVSYHIAKAGLDQLIRYYAVKLGAKGIRVNGVSPGPIIKDESREYFQNNIDLVNLYKTCTPLKRMGTAEEVSKVILFLTSQSASFITGQNIIVDGGMSHIQPISVLKSN